MLFFAPLLAKAQVASFQELLLAIGSLVALLIPIAVALALLFFFWGVTKMIRSAGDEKAIEEGKRIMLWGIVSLFVMVAIWGIVKLIQQDIFSPSHLNPFNIVAP